MRFAGCNVERPFKLNSYLIESIPQLIRRITRVSRLAFRGFCATFRAEINIIWNFFTAVRAVSQFFSPLISKWTENLSITNFLWIHTIKNKRKKEKNRLILNLLAFLLHLQSALPSAGAMAQNSPAWLGKRCSALLDPSSL
jgi:hypothetical protein